MIVTYLGRLPGVVGASPTPTGYRLDLAGGTTREATAAEVHAAALAAITDRIRDECERRQFGDGVPFTVPGIGSVRFQTDEKSRGRYALLQGFATLTLLSGGTMQTPVADPSTGQPIVWNAMGGVQVPLTVGLLVGMLQAAGARENACDATYRAHVAAAALLPDPLAYDFSGGWPA